MDKPTYYAYLQAKPGPGQTPGVELRAFVSLVDFYQPLLLDASDSGSQVMVNRTLNAFLEDVKRYHKGYTKTLGWWKSEAEFYENAEGVYQGSSRTFDEVANDQAYILVIYTSQLHAYEAMEKAR